MKLTEKKRIVRTVTLIKQLLSYITRLGQIRRMMECISGKREVYVVMPLATMVENISFVVLRIFMDVLLISALCVDGR